MNQSSSFAGHGRKRLSGAEHTMTFINNSRNSWCFCCYQKDPEILETGALAAAWLVAANVHPTSRIRFKWKLSCGLSWSQNAAVKTGNIYIAAQDWPVSQSENEVTLT